jgi:sigma-B regulation protein RsbU (phosphoserine phosphatase)
MNAETQEQRKLAAIMFTDMVGYSALAQRNEALALELLEEHRRLLRPIFSGHNGREIETAGDAFLVEFASALEAAHCAVEIQQQISLRNERLSGDRHIKLRIGIHVGDVVHKSGKVMGDAVNIAARVEPLAEPGGICISRAVFEQVEGKLGQPMVSIGGVELKNLARRLEVFRIQFPAAPNQHPPGDPKKQHTLEPGAEAPYTSLTPDERIDLSRMRHELRTPINQILGYCEMLIEEGQLAAGSAADLHRIHAGGRELQSLIARHFDEKHFFEKRDLHQLYHDLRTPVNHIIGYSELLIEQAEDSGEAAPITDLKRIRDAATNWLGLVEAYLIEPALSANSESPEAAPDLALNLGFAFKVPEPKSASSIFHDEGALLVVDDDEASREMIARRLRRSGYTVSAVGNGVHALNLARRQKFDLVLLDLIMPGLDGIQVLAKLRADPALQSIPVVMLSALDDENGVARCIEMGAEDYLSKPCNPVFLRARIGACLEKKRLRDKERATYEALVKSQKHLATELAEAAGYVRSLLPAALTGPVETEWCFQPSEQLGGDAFGYHWIDPDYLAIYLLDVCGHGVGAALLSVSVLNTIRAEGLAGVDFRRASEVLTGLNRAFRMEHQNNLFFSIWYGVYQRSLRQLRFAGGGHPPGLLLAPATSGEIVPRCLRTEAPAVGCLEQARYTDTVEQVLPGSRLLVFSDGAFEIFQERERVGTWQEFVAEFHDAQVQQLRPRQRYDRALELRKATCLEDDFSFLELRFS